MPGLLLRIFLIYSVCLHVLATKDADGDGVCRKVVPCDYNVEKPPGNCEPDKECYKLFIIHLASTIVKVLYYVIGISEINEAANSFDLQTYMTFHWNDSRVLGNDSKLEIPTYIPFDRQKCFWLPYIYFREVNDGLVYDGPLINPVLKVDSSGFSYYKRYRLQVQCKMDLTNYPMDKQSCALEIRPLASSAYVLDWILSQENQSDISVSTFAVRSINAVKEQCSTFGKAVPTPNKKCLKMRFKFERKIATAVITIYFPSVLIVMISFVSFWVDNQSVPGRISLVITSLLALMTQMLSVRGSIPPVAYVTALDIWFFVCVSFVSSVLFEFALAYNFSKPAEDASAVLPVVIPDNLKIGFLKGQLRPQFTNWATSVKLRLDQISRLVFPTAFFAFMAIYWAMYF